MQLLVKDTTSSNWRIKGTLGQYFVNTTIAPDEAADPTFRGIIPVDANPHWLDDEGDRYQPKSYRDVLRGGFAIAIQDTSPIPIVIVSDSSSGTVQPTVKPQPVPSRRADGDIHCSLQKLAMSSSPHICLAIAANPAGSKGASLGPRKRVMFFVLDRSGSMSGDWESVIDGVVAVLTPEIVGDPNTTVHIVAYATDAVVIPLPKDIRGLRDTLLQYKPGGITVFRAAFQLVRDLLELFLRKKTDDRLPQVSILFFTDGCDTSIHVGNTIDVPKSEESARKHYETFRAFVSSTKCDVTTYVAAYTKNHNPELCKFFGDKYKYIDRKETLTQALFTSMAEMVTSSGSCSVVINVPESMTPVELCPPKLPLDHEGNLTYDVWYRVDMRKWNPTDFVRVEVSCVGAELVSEVFQCSELEELSPDSFEHHLFCVRQGKVEVRGLAAQLSEQGVGGKKFVIDTAFLEAQLRTLRETVELTRMAACMPFRKKGDIDTLRKALSTRIHSRDALVTALEELDGMMDRLSFVAFQHVQGIMTDTQTLAILNDSRQHLPVSVRRRLDVVGLGNALRIENRQKVLKQNPYVFHSLSHYGSDLTRDAFSCCDAHEVAADGDAMFFVVSRFKADTAKNPFTIVECVDGNGHIAFQAFRYLKEAGMKEHLSTQYSVSGVAGPFTSIWLPMYCTPQHFSQAVTLLPDALGHLFFGDPLSFDNNMYTFLFDLFGYAVYGCAMDPTEAHISSLLLKLRSMEELTRVALPSYAPSAPPLPPLADSCQHGLPERPWAMIGAFCMSSCRGGRSVQDVAYKLVSILFFKACQSLDVNVPKSQELVSCALRGEHEKSQLFTTVMTRVSNSFPLLDTLAHVFPFLEVMCALDPCDTVFPLLDLSMVTNDHSTVLPQFCDSVKERLPAACNQSMFSIKDMCVAYILQHCVQNISGAHVLKPEEATSILHEAERIIQQRAQLELEKRERAKAKRISLCRKHPVPAFNQITVKCCCGAYYSSGHAMDVWGAPADVDDPKLWSACRAVVLQSRALHWSANMVDARNAAEYRKRGGTYTFGDKGETFLEGLHSRTKDYFAEVRRCGIDPKTHPIDTILKELGDRLVWDDRIPGASQKLKRILSFLWNDLCGCPQVERDISSTLWEQ